MPLLLIAGVLLPRLTMAAPAKAAPQKHSATPSTNAVAAVVELPIPKSIFVVPQNKKQGRDPFFPDSERVAPDTTTTPEPVQSNAIVLNGITSPPKPTAMINSRTFEEGETGAIKMPDGSRLTIQCIQIGMDYAIIQVAGQRRELRLRSASSAHFTAVR